MRPICVLYTYPSKFAAAKICLTSSLLLLTLKSSVVIESSLRSALSKAIAISLASSSVAAHLHLASKVLVISETIILGVALLLLLLTALIPSSLLLLGCVSSIIRVSAGKSTLVSLVHLVSLVSHSLMNSTTSCVLALVPASSLAIFIPA